ncbi:MAG: hypothetical protein ACRC14_13180 [Paracoccaceae bacterium]
MRLRLIAALLLLAACQLTLPGRGLDAPKANPITGDAIAVTPLDAPAADAAKPAPEVLPAPAPEVQPTAAPETQPAAKPSTPPTPKSASQIACEKQKGTWSQIGKSRTMTCVKTLSDSGQSCSRDRDCDGQCLARSRTCAPFSPMFGCNEVLQDDGRRMTLCID